MSVLASDLGTVDVEHLSTNRFDEGDHHWKANGSDGSFTIYYTIEAEDL